MTFSLVGKCGRTGMLGAAVTTSSIGVGCRVPYARPGVGAVCTQHRTDPRLGPRGLDLLEAGNSPSDVIAMLTEDDSTIGWRQLAVVDRNGQTAWFHGDHIKSVHAAAEGEGCCAIGNIIRNEQVPAAMIEAFEASESDPLAERLILALEAGDAAGGEFRLLKSAAVIVAHEHSFPLVDLRVEFDRSPLTELRFLWEIYRPQVNDYVRRTMDPDSIPYPEYE
jgi:uncharacterized Ntn-hydrolase superfamily protein